MSKDALKNNKIDILHIYFGTAGAAGLYLNEIYRALNSFFVQECIVNFYFPFNYGCKYFYKYTELSGINIFKNQKYFRLFLRYIELSIGLTRSFIFILNHKPKITNYSLISQTYLEYIFLYAVKFFSPTKIILTLHDVVPFKSMFFTFIPPIFIKQKIISLADFLLIHNQNSELDLKGNFIFDQSKLIIHEFPLMDANLLFDTSKSKSPVDTINEFVFLFIGQGRLEKGVDLLIDAWKMASKKMSAARLIIAGNFQKNSPLLSDFLELQNSTLINKFLSDDEYFQLIFNADCIVLPYKRGTNSGIPGTCLSLGTDLICSDIPMFRCNPLLFEANFFEANSSQSIADKLVVRYGVGRNYFNNSENILNLFRIDFDVEINNLYKSLINPNI